MAFLLRRLARSHGHLMRPAATRLNPLIPCRRLFSTEPVQEDPAPTIAVDRSALYTPPSHSHNDSQEETQMAKHLKTLIKFRGGPLTVAEYMEEVLTNPSAGFYMHRDVFGVEGDFVTSPDVSQMFGELVGVWTMCLWEQMGQPKKLTLVELGPGRGTLMADLLRGTKKFEEFTHSISVHLVECSPALRNIQEKVLGYVPNKEASQPRLSNKHMECGDSSSSLSDGISQLSGAPISWHADLKSVPEGDPTIIIAHEFFDALPIHQFQRTSRGWHEKLVDIADGPGSGFRFVLSPGPTVASKLYLAQRMKWEDSVEEKGKLEHVEVCPQALDITREIARRVGSNGGGALVIDYGEDKIVSDSLQAITKHKFAHVLEDPGKSDLSAYVDFAALRHAVQDAAVGATAFGPITQSQFLGMLGINFRLEALLSNASDEQAEALKQGYWRLVGDGPPPWSEGEDEKDVLGVGSRYKALAIVNTSLGAPICFQ